MARVITVRIGKVDAYIDDDVWPVAWQSSDPELALELNRQETLRPLGYVPDQSVAMANWAIEQMGFGEITQRPEPRGVPGAVY